MYCHFIDELIEQHEKRRNINAIKMYLEQAIEITCFLGCLSVDVDQHQFGSVVKADEADAWFALELVEQSSIRWSV